MDFLDPQGGKGACDRKAATVKAHIRVHLNEGHDVETASQMVEAMQSSGGVPGLNVSLCDRVVPPSPAGQVKLDGVSTVANVEYGNTYIRVWKAYGIGPGKKIPLSKINIPANFQIARLSAVSSDQELCDQFSAVKVTVDLQGCLPKNHSRARLLCYNHRKVHIIGKLIKFRI